MKISGIDPGTKGYVVTVDTMSEMAWKYRLRFDAQGLLNYGDFVDGFLDNHNPDLILLEKVNGREGWGATQTFSFGYVYGQLHLAIKLGTRPYRLVSPQTWQKEMHKGISPKLKPKTRSEIAYQQMFPHDPVPIASRAKKRNDNITDSLLIAAYGALTFGGGIYKPWSF
jgi:hypothetical protein